MPHLRTGPPSHGKSLAQRQWEEQFVEPSNAPSQQTQAMPALGSPEASLGNSDWWQELRMRIIEFGIHVLWGKSAFPATMAADVSLMSGAWRMAWIRALGAVGFRQFTAKSGLGYDFICHIGDLAEYPFYHRSAFRDELAICTAWLRDEHAPVVFDVGANVGFFATQLAQMLARQSLEVYAFEPVPTTFVKLVQSVNQLGLNDLVHPIAAAVLDDQRPVHLSFSDRNSLYAQVAAQARARAGDALAQAPSVTLDDFQSFVGVRPALLKIDVEGCEIAVLRGARRLLAQADRPAILFEYNPDTLMECGAAVDAFHELLEGYALYYIDDFEGRKKPFGSRIARVEDTQYACNLFAVPLVEGASTRWTTALDHARRQLGDKA
jgi:FkbM family methyltransferase